MQTTNTDMQMLDSLKRCAALECWNVRNDKVGQYVTQTYSSEHKVVNAFNVWHVGCVEVQAKVKPQTTTHAQK